MIDILHVSQTAGYFARVIDTPWIVKQERLDELQAQMGAQPSVDFQLSSYVDVTSGEVARTGRLFHLPFRLSLGLHESVPPTLNREATVAIFGVYQAAKPMHPKASGLPLKAQKIERARSAIGGALLEAAADRQNLGLVQEALRFTRSKRLLDRIDSANVKQVIGLLSRS